MDESINKLLILDQNIRDFINDNCELSEDEFDNLLEEKGYVNKAINILNRLNRKNRIEAIKRCEYLWSFIDITKYMIKYPIDKEYLRNNTDKYIEEYKSLQDFCLRISDYATSYKDFDLYARKLDIDGVEDYLLKHMPNDQLYKLSCSTNDWVQKLFYFSYFKKEKKS